MLSQFDPSSYGKMDVYAIGNSPGDVAPEEGIPL
jgi:hypothetical protein